ncbi:DUF979 domain-containing protein [Alicyclobacillus tolerans]|uniref:Uncharacterized membrane protein n=1 Tax=Alicyclobacillus tolerans TaxID=90970 RepID=A0A1M6NJC9_9BACL|nr:DUF979 domain-containing protein [Alicyclobacillus montanus]SHJ95783.1 Uncharacterized membrane protein [Alicyclobacillus montanus]
MILSTQTVYVFIGLITLIGSIFTFFDKQNLRRWTTGMFYLLYAVTLISGHWIPPFYIGLMVIGIVLLAGLQMVKTGSYGEASVQERLMNRNRFGNKLFLPALLIPILTVLGVEWIGHLRIAGRLFYDPSNVTMVALAVATFIALLVGLGITRSNPITSLRESRRLLESIGWAAVLPQMLATLGTLFNSAGVGDVVAKLLHHVIPSNSLFWAVFAYCVSMALFTMIMGNAFAAFPVMTAGIAIPFIIQHFGIQADRIAAIGMFAGYCGTLMTPMAANFNIVPATLLDLKNKYQVIKVQWPTAVILLAVNIALMYSVARI